MSAHELGKTFLEPLALAARKAWRGEMGRSKPRNYAAVMAEDEGVCRILEQAAEWIVRQATASSTPPEPRRQPPGSAACPVCLSVYYDSDHAAECCPESRERDTEDDA